MFKTEQGKVFAFVMNNFTLSVSQIVTIYKNRWMIELLFKQTKQSFSQRYFGGATHNAVKLQVYFVLIAQLLMMVLLKKVTTKKSFTKMLPLLLQYKSTGVLPQKLKP